MLKSKITRRWLRNSFGVIVAIILIIEIVGGIAVKRYYYNQVTKTLVNSAESVATSLQQLSRDSSVDFNDHVSGFVTEFSDKDKMELMIIGENGETKITSSGFIPAEKAMPDYIAAMDNPNFTGSAVGSLDKDQRVMLVSRLVPVPDEPGIAAIRLATSLTDVDKQIFYIVTLMIILGVSILGLVLFSSYYFIDGIVRPIGKVGETARRIAQGDLNARLTIKYDDEIGELSDMINYMAGELQRTEQMKNDFISSVSHELRTPLTAIQGWGETIRLDKGQDKELLEKGMTVIIGETERLSGMVEELLDFSRMQSGRLKLVKAPVNPVIELTEAVFMYTQRAQRENIKLIYDYEEPDITVYADKNRLRQVFINIIDNAIKYSDPGDTVTVEKIISESTITVIIADTGIGISESDLPKITNRFYKADSTRRGSGIGLAVAEEIINRHEGHLVVESHKGKGTTITITLPLYNGGDSVEVEDTAGITEKTESEII